MWDGNNGMLRNCNFINNTAGAFGGAVYWSSNALNGIITSSTFINNNANSSGGVRWYGANGKMSNCTFINFIYSLDNHKT